MSQVKSNFKRCDRCDGILETINGRIPGHFPGCFLSNRVPSNVEAKVHQPIVVTKKQQDVNLRRKAMKIMSGFIDDYFRGDGKIHIMSPKRVLEILRDDVAARRRLGPEEVQKIRDAANILSS